MFKPKIYAFCNGHAPDSLEPIQAGICDSKAQLKRHIAHSKNPKVKVFTSKYEAQIWCKLQIDDMAHPDQEEPYHMFKEFAHAFSRTMVEMQSACKNAGIEPEQFNKLMTALKVQPGINEIFKPTQIPIID